ncbi:Zinc/iron permease [Radiomyces spectabilis]|uniref:Zinc/iron permease n=1 Tax=Radiomyces spectabilis TaxID=64574 RepID=UPI00222098E6|nr:Zinc/iron permease [Radiomyces spectabilis]KAI8379720.1 Zinc/iron permease [Radiomyces spectabilis]
MLNPFVWLLLLCLCMLIGSFLAGCIPLATKLSESKLRIFSAISVGLLVGTALVVIVPEGVETLYNSNQYDALDSTDTTDSRPAHIEESHGSLHASVGLALIIGFALMFVIDQLSSLHVHPSPSANAANADATEYNQLDTLLVSETALDNDLPEAAPEASTHHAHSHQQSLTPTIGLIIHAAADGIALGASASHPQLSMVVFLAIMLHKAPSAFALTTVLLAEGLSRIQIRKHLLMFSLSAPIGALTTYLLLYASALNTASASLEYWTGILLIFSGGTFLYVAMHALQEVQSYGAMDRPRVYSILGGMILPLILNMQHSH